MIYIHTHTYIYTCVCVLINLLIDNSSPFIYQNFPFFSQTVPLRRRPHWEGAAEGRGDSGSDQSARRRGETAEGSGETEDGQIHPPGHPAKEVGIYFIWGISFFSFHGRWYSMWWVCISIDLLQYTVYIQSITMCVIRIGAHRTICGWRRSSGKDDGTKMEFQKKPVQNVADHVV